MNSNSSERSAYGRAVAYLAGLLILALALAYWLLPGPGESEEPASEEVAVEAVAPANGPREVRPPSVAGQFYPADPQELYGEVERLMNAEKPLGLKGVRAVLVPHAGYVYSGAVAAASFRQVDPSFDRVFLLAANHNGDARFTGVSIPQVSHYAVPGVEVPLAGLVDSLRALPLCTSVPAAHTMHMLEIELPFLHYLKGCPERASFTIVPMIVGRLDRAQMGQLVELLAAHDDGRTLFVFSVDLSHYYTDEQARKLDSYALQGLLSRDVEELGQAATDGNHVLATLAELALAQGWQPTFLEYRNSGEANGDASRVVGYGSIVFGAPFELEREEQRELLAYARRTIEERLEGRESRPDVGMLKDHPLWGAMRGVFVTLKKEGQLRGCIGSIANLEPLYSGIHRCALNAAFEDPRFPPLGREELDEVELSISVLDFPGPLRVEGSEEYLEKLRPHVDGVILMHAGRQSTYLPAVWEEIPEPREFLSRLCLKQGSRADCWQDTATVVYRYAAYEFGED